MTHEELYTDSRLKPFNYGWRFTAPDGAAETEVTLPHGWNSIGWTYEENQNTDAGGTGVYTKTVNGNALEGCTLKFGGVSAFCEVFLNGKKICENIGAYRAFEVVLEGLSDGENILTVKVTDKEHLKPLPAGCDSIFEKSPRYKNWPTALGSSLKAGGIWRDVFVAEKCDTYMEAFVIEPCGTRFEVQPNIVGCADGYKIKYTLTDGAETLSGEIAADAKMFEIEPKNPVLTWPLHTHMYSLTTSLVDKNGAAVQTIKQPAYLMRLEVRNSGFRLNNKPYFLRGQNGFPHCNVHYDKDYIEKYVGECKKQGVEISRFHTEPPAHAWLDECDRQGIMVILEMPLHGSFGCYSFGSEEFEKNALGEILNIVKEYRRHPCIALWSMGNELIVSSERDIGLGKDLFDILERWIAEVRKLDSRPIISNSNGDAANLINKTVGDVDDIHQYGGWYVENLRDLRHLAQYTIKNDMLFQPCISTESIAAYTDNEEKCFLRGSDVRQKKIIAQRLGKIYDLAKQSREYQAFMLKEYAEQLWRLRVEGSSFSGYIPFGQYTWFFDPFDKDKIRPKSIWNTYRKVLSPVHAHFECFDRHIEKGGSLRGSLRMWHENVHLPEKADFEIEVSCGSETLLKRNVTVEYHKSYCEKVEIGPLAESGRLDIKVTCGGTEVCANDFEFRAYDRNIYADSANIYVYDPENLLPDFGTKITSLDEVNEDCKGLVVGPYAIDRSFELMSERLRGWVENGGSIAILEQNPGNYTDNILGLGITAARVCQPYWSRWATNLVRHTDRADICDESDALFEGIGRDDMFWWNGDTFLADSYLSAEERTGARVVSRIGNGLASTELMPVEYEYEDSGYSITALECGAGKGRVFATSLLVGTKCKNEPVAGRLLNNIINWLKA